MTTDHALLFIFNGPREGGDARAMEAFNAKRAFWEKRKESGDITNIELVMLALPMQSTSLAVIDRLAELPFIGRVAAIAFSLLRASARSCRTCVGTTKSF